MNCEWNRKLFFKSFFVVVAVNEHKMASKFPEDIRLAPFKFFVQKGLDCPIEVRKLNLEISSEDFESSVLSFRRLQSVVQDLLTSLSTNNFDEKTESFQIQYVDDDGDKITIKSDSELETYLLDQVTDFSIFLSFFDICNRFPLITIPYYLITFISLYAKFRVISSLVLKSFSQKLRTA